MEKFPVESCSVLTKWIDDGDSVTDSCRRNEALMIFDINLLIISPIPCSKVSMARRDVRGSLDLFDALCRIESD